MYDMYIYMIQLPKGITYEIQKIILGRYVRRQQWQLPPRERLQIWMSRMGHFKFFILCEKFTTGAHGTFSTQN